MDESKIALPFWLPWATTAILAALVACVGEMWVIERARNELLREETTVAASVLKSSQNELEAERIVSGRELSRLGHDLSVAFLSPMPGDPRQTCGAIVWNKGQGHGILTVYNLSPERDSGDFQLWMFDSNSTAPSSESSCVVFESPNAEAAFGEEINLAIPETPGLRFYLIYGKKGGFATLKEAVHEGSIVLASPHR